MCDERSMRAKQFAVRRLNERSSTQSDDRRRRRLQHLLQALPLNLPKLRLAVEAKDLGDWPAFTVDDLGVEIDELPAESSGQFMADSGLARAHESCEADPWRGSAVRWVHECEEILASSGE